MEQIEERLIEEVRKYENLYVTSHKDYKDAQKTNNSWREIAETVEMDFITCIKKWRFLRDKYVRLRKKMASCSGDAGGVQKVPALYFFLSWLAPHVIHRHTSSNYYKEQTSPPVSVDIDGSLDLLSVNTRAPTESPKTSPEPSDLSSCASSPASQLPTTSQPEISPIASSNSSTGSQVESLPSPSTPAAPMTAPSPLSRWGQKKKRQREIDDGFAKKMERLEERKLAIEKRLQDTGDEYSRFGQIVADLLRKVPLEKRDSLMYQVYGMIHAQRQ